MTVDRRKLHPHCLWRKGFYLRANDEPGRPLPLAEVESQIEAMRPDLGDEEADRLRAELRALVAMQQPTAQPVAAMTPSVRPRPSAWRRWARRLSKRGSR